MSNVLNYLQPAMAEESAQSPTVTHYQQIAAQVSAAITAAFADIAPLEKPHPSRRHFVRANAAVRTNFIAVVIAAVEAIPELQGVRFDADDARDALQFGEAFRPIVDQLEVLARELKFTIDARKANAAQGALNVYAAAKRYARDPKSELTSATEIMCRELGRTYPRPKEKDDADRAR